MADSDAQTVFAANRAEEIGHDVWEQFVIFPSYGQLGIGGTRKPKVIIGGRGCGKTMLLRYLSHESAFSLNRSEIPPEALGHIGVYWKADTQFASMLEKRGLDEDVWRAAFDHLAAVVLSIEVLRSLKSISASKLDKLNAERLTLLDFSQLNILSDNRLSTYNELITHLENRLADFENWANDVRSMPQPKFLPGSRFVKRLIEHVQNQIPEMHGSVFFVYIDEYENLGLYQQRMINTWLKHSEQPLIFNLAMKRNGFKTRRTEGAESLSDIHDYRTIDLEEFGSSDAFAVSAAEILLSRRLLAGEQVLESDIDLLQALRDPSGLECRRAHRQEIVDAAKAFFPSPTHSELAHKIFEDENLVGKLRARVKRILRDKGNTSRSPDGFISKDFPEASIVVPALLARRSLTVKQVEKEWKDLKLGKPNKFTGPTEWIHNNFIGCYLQLFDGLVRPCPFYSGFNTFSNMAHGNLRHFLELCHQARSRLVDGESLTPEMQSEAARQVAADFLSEVRSFGPQGNNLHAFLLRLGTLFSLSQQSPPQSEPERTHFSIKEGVASLSDDQNKFLSEAVKWSVISETKGTKKKASSDPEGLEYVINPIYSPYFHISYRKGRKLEMTSSEVGVLIDGSYDDVKALLGRYKRKWLVDLEDTPPSLFAHLEETS